LYSFSVLSGESNIWTNGERLIFLGLQNPSHFLKKRISALPIGEFNSLPPEFTMQKRFFILVLIQHVASLSFFSRQTLLVNTATTSKRTRTPTQITTQIATATRMPATLLLSLALTFHPDCASAVSGGGTDYASLNISGKVRTLWGAMDRQALLCGLLIDHSLVDSSLKPHRTSHNRNTMERISRKLLQRVPIFEEASFGGAGS